MTKNEFWFLNLVVRWAHPLHALRAKDDEFTTFANRSPHGLTAPELKACLRTLFDRGDLKAYRPRTEKSSSQEFKPTTEDLEAGLSGDEEIYFGITPQGGARWEEVSKPRWDYFISEASYSVDDIQEEGARFSDYEVIALEEKALRKWLSLSEEPFGEPVWSTVRPWHPVHWKTLPMAHRLNVRFRYDLNAIHRFRSEREETVDFRRQLAKLRLAGRKWYTNPWT